MGGEDAALRSERTKRGASQASVAVTYALASLRELLARLGHAEQQCTWAAAGEALAWEHRGNAQLLEMAERNVYDAETLHLAGCAVCGTPSRGFFCSCPAGWRLPAG